MPARPLGLVPLLLTALLSLAVPPAGPAEAAGTLPDCAAPAGESWTSTPAPDLSAYANASFPDGDELLSHALDTAGAPHHWVASSAAVLRSTDGGCTWSEAVALPEVPTTQLPYTRGLHRIERLLAGRTDRDRQRVLALGRSFLGDLVLLRSDDGGAAGTWHAHPQPQMTGNLLGAALAPGDADRVYAVVDRATVALLEVHVSDDGGRTWSLESSIDLQGQRTIGAVGDAVLAIDPLDPDVLLLSAGGSGLLRSSDGGRTFTRSSGPRLAGALALHRSAAAASVAAFESADPVVHLSRDGGASWHERGTGAPKPFRRAAYGLTSDTLLAVQGPSAPRFLEQTGMAVWRWDAATGEFRDITPIGRPLLYEPLPDGAGGFVLHGPDGLWTWHGDRPRATGDQPATELGLADPTTRLLPAAPPPPAPARLDLPAQVVLQPGQERDVQVRLVVPPRPRDLDLALLFDTTNSMSGTIDALRTDAQRLVDALAAGGNRARFGVAEFQDYPLAPYGQPVNRAYARLRDLAPVDPALRGHLAALSTRDDLDVHTSGLTGLLQVATGAGQTGLPRAPQSDDPNLPAGQGMSFNPEAVKVVVTFADEPFHDSAAHPGPSLTETVEALRSRGVLGVGVAVGGRPAGAGPDLRRVAAGTGALAPVDVDCGDSVVPAGAPLVCEVGDEALRLSPDAPGGRFVEAVTALVAAVPAPALASLTADAPDGLTAAVSAGVPVDLRARSTASFTVTLGCTQAGTAALPLTARVGSGVVASGGLVVVCGPAAPAAPPALPPGAAVPVLPGDGPTGALAAAPPVAPPPAVQVPAPAVQAAPGNAGAAQAGSATAPGTSTAAQVGLAGAPGQTAAGRVRAYVDGRTDGLPLTAVPLAGGLLATAAATTHLLTTRRRPTPAPARSRRTGDAR